jgi:TetR/AcrR family transcriptional regulator
MREQLLAAAVELFAEQGVAATTFAVIANRAGVTPAMLHYYFEDREQLLDAVVHEQMAPVIEHVWNPVSSNGSPTHLVRGIVERLLDAVQRLPWLPSLWIRDVLNEGGLLRTRVMQQVPLRKVQAFVTTVRQGQRSAGINHQVDPALLVFSILALVMLHCATAAFWAETFHRAQPTRKRLERHITTLLLYGLTASPDVER